MSIQDFTKPNDLERLAFQWSEARLVVAAVSLLIGGYPVIWVVLPLVFFYPLVTFFLTISWIISGLASAYLLYRWNEARQMLFGKKDSLDLAAFLVSVISGVNLGLTGVLGRNIGMSIFWGRFFFAVAGIAYLGAAYHLWMRWKASGRKLFH